MKSSILVFLILLAIGGCRKKVVEFPTPVYQYFVNGFLTHAGSHRLFTRAGEIKDPALVQQYKNEFAGSFYNIPGGFYDREFTKFAAVSNDSLINLSIVPVAEVKRKLIDEYDKFSNKGSVPVNDTNDLALHLEKYRIYQPKTTPSGFTYFDVESPVYILKRVNNTLFFPMVKYIVVSRGANIVTFNESKFNNVFSPLGISKLGTLDTLLVQTFDLGMKKEP